MDCICMDDHPRRNSSITFHSSYSSEDVDEEEELRRKIDAGNIDDAVAALRQGGLLGDDDARALFGKMEFNRGNLAAALRLFDAVHVTPVSALRLEAALLKAKSLALLNRFHDAALACAAVLSAAPPPLADVKIRKIVAGAAALLPELWLQAGHPDRAVAAYRNALAVDFGFDRAAAAALRRNLAVFLLYNGDLEEALLLLTFQWRMMMNNQIEMDHDLIDHLSFGFAAAGDLAGLAALLRALPPATVPRKDRFFLLALCSGGETAVQLLDRVPEPVPLEGLHYAADICWQDPGRAEDGAVFARRALAVARPGPERGLAQLLLGLNLSSLGRAVAGSDIEMAARQREVLVALEAAEASSRGADPRVLRALTVEHAEQRRLGLALKYAERAMWVNVGSDPESWVVLARILSAQDRLPEAEAVLEAGLGQTGGWDQRRLLLTMARVQVARSEPKQAIQTYARLLALAREWREQVGAKEMEVAAWIDLAKLYGGMKLWKDANTCVLSAREVGSAEADTWHMEGMVEAARGRPAAALAAYQRALVADAGHAPSLVAAAELLVMGLGGRPMLVVREWLCDALRHDRTSHKAWLALGRLRAAEGGRRAAAEAADCFQAAVLLEESAPVEPFR